MKKIFFAFFLFSVAIFPSQAATDYADQDDHYGSQDDIYGYADDVYGRNDDLYGTIDSAYGAIDDLYGYIDDQEGRLDGLPDRKDPDIQAEIERANRGIKTIQEFIDVSYEQAESFAVRIAEAGASLSVLQGIMVEIDQEIISLDANVESVHGTFEFGTAYDVTGSVDLIYARVSDSYGLISDLWGVADDLVGVLDGIPGNTDSRVEALLKELRQIIKKIDDNVQLEYSVANEYYQKISDAWDDEDRLYELKHEIEAEAERFYGKNLSLAEDLSEKAQNITESDDDTHCPQVYAPVCGKPYSVCAAANTYLCEQNGKPPRTYTNRCELEKYHADFLYEGECHE